MMSKERMVKVGVRFPKLFIKEGRKIASREGLNFSQFVRRTVAREFLSRREKA